MDDTTFLHRFESADFGCDEWKHRHHVKIAYLYLLDSPLDVAIDRMRDGLNNLNARHKVPDAIDRGYHETMTEAWMRVVHATLKNFGPKESSDAFCDEHPHLLQRTLLRLYYSRGRIMTAEAKTHFVEPDIAPLPNIVSAKL